MKTSGGGPRSSGVAAMAVTRELGNALSLWGSRVGSMAAETGRSCSRAAVTDQTCSPKRHPNHGARCSQGRKKKE